MGIIIYLFTICGGLKYISAQHIVLLFWFLFWFLPIIIYFFGLCVQLANIA